MIVYNARPGYDPGLCAGTTSVGELAGAPPGRPARRPVIVECKPAARAVRWVGDRAVVEQLTGRCVADSLITADAIYVDAWGTPQVCPFGWWVVVRVRQRIVVLSPRQFSTAYTIVPQSRGTAKEAA